MIVFPLVLCQGYFVGYLKFLEKGVWDRVFPLNSNTPLSQDVRLTTVQELVKYTHPGAEITTINTASQTGVEVRDSIWSAHWLVLVGPTTTVNVTASGQVPVRHGERGSKSKKKQMADRE